MKLIKKISTICMIISLLVTSFNVAYAESAANPSTRDGKATILNELNILRGSGTSYNLDSKLKRSEAAAFIVRLLNKESDVTTNSKQYAYTAYTDVSPDEWYAPYVGYCDKNSIINGFSDKTFKPNNYLSEKEFLKMLLSALDYAFNVDYTWDSVFSTAYQAGIVKDVKYATQKEDNKAYTRGSVVEAIYAALSVPSKKTNVRMIQSYIDALLISKEKAVTYLFISDALETSIQSIEVKSSTVVEVTFNEAVKSIKPEDINIYETNVLTNTLKVKSVSATALPNVLSLTFEAEQRPYAEYTIILNKVTDQNNNVSQMMYSSFLGFRPVEFKSDYFRISKIETVNNNTVNLYFTQPVNDNVLVPTYFTLKKDNTVLVAGSAANVQVTQLTTATNAVSISFKNFSFTKEASYELFVDGKATSTYGVRLNEDQGDFVKFTGTAQEGAAFELTKITALNNTTVQLDFSVEVNAVIAEQIYSYYVTSATATPIPIVKAKVLETSGKSVLLSLGTSLIVNQKYNIMINNLTDVSRQYSITERKYDFVGTSNVASNVKVAGINSIDANIIKVYFDKPLDFESAMNVNNFQLAGASGTTYFSIPTAIYYNPNENEGKMIKVYLPKDKALESNKNYEFRVLTGLKDAMGNPQTVAGLYTFTSGSSQVVETFITEAKIVGAGTIKLSFNQELALDVANLLNTNYSITYTEQGTLVKKTPVSVNYIDPATIILKFDNLDTTKVYTITYKQLVNYGKVITDNGSGKFSATVINGK